MSKGREQGGWKRECDGYGVRRRRIMWWVFSEVDREKEL